MAQRGIEISEALPPYSPEAERGVLGCCLINPAKTQAAIQAGVTSRWFYDLRHAEIFNVLTGMALNGGGDSLIATLILRDLGRLEGIGGNKSAKNPVIQNAKK